MKCNYKRAFEQQEPIDIVKEFEQFMEKDTKKSYFNEKTKTLNDDFFENLNDFISEINLNRLEDGIEEFINLEISEDNRTGIYVDDAYPDEKKELKTPYDFMDLYVSLNVAAFKDCQELGLLPL